MDACEWDMYTGYAEEDIPCRAILLFLSPPVLSLLLTLILGDGV